MDSRSTAGAAVEPAAPEKNNVAISGERRDGAAGSDLADAAVGGIADIKVHIAIDRDIGGAVELGFGGRSVVAGESAEASACTGAISCIRADDALGGHLADDVVRTV